MLTLFHHPFCPHSRFVRLVLEELSLPVRLVEDVFEFLDAASRVFGLLPGGLGLLSQAVLFEQAFELVDAALRGLDGMKVAVSDADIPGDEAIRADFDAFLGHDQSAIEQREFADLARALRPD